MFLKNLLQCVHFQRFGFDKLLRNRTWMGQIRITCTLCVFKWGLLFSDPLNENPVELLTLWD